MSGITWRQEPGTMWAGLPRIGFYQDGRLLGYMARRDVDKWTDVMFYEAPSGLRFDTGEEAAAHLIKVHEQAILRPKTDRVRNDGNWIYGNPATGAQLLAHHTVGAAPLPEIPGWVRPRYGFTLNLQADQRQDVICMSYYPAPPPPPPARPVQLSLFD